MLKHYYDEIKLAFYENKIFIIVSLLILIFSLFSGYFLKPLLYDILNPAFDDLTQKVDNGVIQLTFHDIFINNLFIILRMFIYGLLFCLSVVILAYNGFFIGYYVAINEDFFRVLVFLLPHGIFELSSCVLACSSGLVLFKFLFHLLKSYYYDYNFKDSVLININILKQSLIIFSVAVVLMIIAGFIEVYITVPFADLILN